MFLNALDKRHPLFAVNLWITGTSLPQPAPAFEVGLTDREGSPIVYPSVVFGLTVSWQGSAGQLELLFMIGSIQPVTKAVRSPSFRNFVPKHALTR